MATAKLSTATLTSWHVLAVLVMCLSVCLPEYLVLSPEHTALLESLKVVMG